MQKAIGGVLLLLLLWYVISLPSKLFDTPYSTVLTDRKGELLGARIASDGQWRFPERYNVPDKVRACLIEFEDRAFAYHWGVNPIAMSRALYQNIREGRVVSGGSTLTMQTIRLARNKPRTIGEKIVEMVLATRLEFRHSKNRILALYVSHAPFGGNVVGLDAAAWRYFGHPSDELSWAESAMLAVLPNAPTMIHLAKGRNMLLIKRNKLLKRLHTKGVIDDSAYELALSEPLPAEPLPLPQIAPHLADYFVKTKPGEYAVSTIDKGLQLQTEALIERWSGEFTRSDIRNMAVMVVDVRRNEVVAYCGNVHNNRGGSGNQVDVIRSPRSSGSILKPFLYYAMLQEGEILPDMLTPDIPLNINGFAPQNFGLNFEGAVPASEALARSLNIPLVTMLQRYSVPKFYDFLHRIGFSTINRSSANYGLSLILGGAETTLWDVTNAYTDMARSLLGLDKNRCSLILADSIRKTYPQVFRSGAVWQTFDAIKEVNRPEEIDWHTIPSMQTIAWKTGTSYGFRDAWAVGVTPRYAVGVWVGNATGEGKPGLVGARTAGPVMFDVFNFLPFSSWFSKPTGDTFIEAEVCKFSGHLKGRFCDDTDTTLILPAGLKTEVCPFHHQVALSADESCRVYENNMSGSCVIKNWFTLPPVWEWYYKQHHPEYKILPPYSSGSGEESTLPMQFIYPTMNARISIPKQMDGKRGEIIFELAHSNPRTKVFWHLDDNYITATEDFHKVSLTPPPGKHSMTTVDSSGNTVSVTFFVE